MVETARRVDFARQQTAWIGHTLKDNLNPPIPNYTVYALAVGNGEELLHLRTSMRPDVSIIALELSIKDTARISARASDVELFQGDITKVAELISQYGIPGTIICRSPRIAEDVHIKTGTLITINEWWLYTLNSWADQLTHQGQMLVTTFHPMEAELLANKMRASGKVVKVKINQNSPVRLRRTLGIYTYAPDGTVLIYQKE